MSSPVISVRHAVQDDIPRMCDLLNEIIRIGGTTAHEKQLSNTEFAEAFFDEKRFISLLVALDKEEKITGFQSLQSNAKLVDDWTDIATFARVANKVPGVGTALFDENKRVAMQTGFAAINATIRADNMGGLKYYEKMGFETYSIEEGKPLLDGRPVDRISKKYLLVG